LALATSQPSERAGGAELRWVHGLGRWTRLRAVRGLSVSAGGASQLADAGLADRHGGDGNADTGGE